jgi:hypothetical protein
MIWAATGPAPHSRVEAARGALVTRALQHGHVVRNRLIRVVIGLIGGRSTWSQTLARVPGLPLRARRKALLARIAELEANHGKRRRRTTPRCRRRTMRGPNTPACPCRTLSARPGLFLGDLRVLQIVAKIVAKFGFSMVLAFGIYRNRQRTLR